MRRCFGLLLVLASCTQTDHETTQVFDPYSGDAAYPNRRPVLVGGDAGERALVANGGSDTVSVLDLTAGAVAGSPPVGRDPIDIDGPQCAVADPARGVAYVVLSYPTSAVPAGPHAAHQGAARSGFVQKLALQDLRKLGETRVDPSPGEAALSDDGRRLVVTHFDRTLAAEADAGIDFRRATLAILDPDKILATDSAVPNLVKVCLAPRGLVLSPGAGSAAYVACYGEDAVAVVDLEDLTKPVERIPVGPQATTDTYGPYALTRAPTAGVLAVVDTISKDVRLFDPATKAFRPTTITTEGTPGTAVWSQDEASLLIPTQSPDALVVADASTGAILRTRAFDGGCTKPVSVTFAGRADTLNVTCEGAAGVPGAVVALDASTLDQKTTFPVGLTPDRLTFLRAP